MGRLATGITLGMVLAAGAGAGVRANTASGDLESQCLLDSATVAAVTGAEIVNVSVSGAGVGSSAAGSSLLAPPDLSWSGCSYNTADESEFAVAELTETSDGLDALEQFESVRALAGVRDEVRSIVADLGDEAFVTDRGEIVVLDGKQTLRFRVDVILDVTGISLLADVANGVLAVTEPDTPGRCSALVRLVPDEWGEPGDAMAGGGTENGFTYDSCAVRPAAFEGGTLGVDIADGRDWYDFELADEAPMTPVLVEGIGDVAYAYGRVNGFVMLVGDRALIVSGEDADREALDPAALESLAVEAATAAGWDPAPTGASTAPGTATTDAP